ncbi:MAG: DUF167 domain-containing protein [Actinomycetes bacterium]
MTAPPWLTERDGTVRLRVVVVPGAARSQIVGPHDGSLRIRIAQRAVDGAANRALVALLSKTLRTAKSTIEIERGLNSKHKTVSIAGYQLEAARRCLVGESSS